MLDRIKKKIASSRKLEGEELMFLYALEDMSLLAELSGIVRERFNGRKVYYNRNFHLEPSNVCIHRCRFCSYRRDSAREEGAWTMDPGQVEKYLKEKYEPDMTEVHIVGSVNPDKDFDYYLDIIRLARRTLPPHVKIKAYSAVEIADMCAGAGLSLQEGLLRLQQAGLDAVPGGGAEIFNPQIRQLICPDKPDARTWLEVHRVAHRLGLHTNATMLFGHIESREHRVEHLLMLRKLQEETGGFDAFIPLKYRIANNALGCPDTKNARRTVPQDPKTSGTDNRKTAQATTDPENAPFFQEKAAKERNSEINTVVQQEAGILEVMRTFAVSRLALSNIPHIKSYWPMLGKDLCQLSLLFGADDIDGTINRSTKIYSMAGAEEQDPGLSAQELVRLAERAGFRAVERDSYYREV